MLRKGLVHLFTLAAALVLGCSAVEARLSAPSNVAPTALSASAIEITWADVNDNVIGFVIERSAPDRRRRFRAVATLDDGAARSWVDTGLTSDTTYYYRLRALQERRSKSGKLRRPRKSRRSKPVPVTTLAAGAPAPQPTATPVPQPTVAVPPGGGGSAAPWARRLGASATDIGTAAAVDAAGNVVVAGRFMGTLGLGGTQLSSRGGFDVFLAKYAPGGSLLWARSFGSAGGDDASAVAVDGAGNVVVTGFFEDTATIGGASLTSAGEMDVFVTKLAPDGTFLWSHGFGGPNTDIGYAIGTQSDGSVVVAGSFHGTVSFGGPPLAASPYNPTDLFVATYSPGGAHQWSRNFESAGRAIAYGLGIGSDGRIALTGLFSGRLDLGAGALTSSNWTDDVFVALLTSTGTPVWSRGFGGTLIDYGTAVAVDPGGDVVVTGLFRHSVDFGGGALPDSGLGNAFLAKYAAADGRHLWSRHAGSFTGTDLGVGLAVDAGGNPSLVGRFQATADFGGASLTSAGGTDGFLARYGAGGGLLGATRLGGAGDDLANAIALAPGGAVVVAGGFSGTVDLVGTALTSAGGHDAFVLQILE